MIDTVLNAVIGCLKDSGIDAMRALPTARAGQYAEPVVTVALSEAKAAGSGMGEYLGLVWDEGRADWRELYGFRLIAEIALEIWSARDGARGAAGCDECFSEISEALKLLPSGLKLRSLSRGRTEFDGASDMFRCEAQLDCATYIYAQRDSAEDVFSDFIVKGEII